MPIIRWKEDFLKVILFLITLAAFGLYSCAAEDESYQYAGEWDLPAKSVAELCYIVENDLPPESRLPRLHKSTYLRNGKCWKYRWNPCDNVDSKEEYIGPDSIRPCGYYQMVEAPSHEC